MKDMVLSNIPSKIEGNLKARKDSVVGTVRNQVTIGKDAVQTQVTVVKGGVGQLLDMRPVPALIDTLVGTIDNVADTVTDTLKNVGDAVKDQAKISRDWVE